MKNNFELFNDNLELYSSMLKDISFAKKYVFLEIFRFNNDSMGEKFRSALIEKAKEKVKVKVLIDAWGSGTDLSFFEPMKDVGIQLRVYRKINLRRAYFAKNHCRNHRKMLVIDDNIGYIGSSNISAYSLSWRELNFKIQDTGIIRILKRSFSDSFRTYNKYFFSKNSAKRDLHIGDWLFIQDIPNSYKQRIKTKYEHLISKAKKEIIIETPYFLPGHKLRKDLCEAAERGVDVNVVMPFHSDVQIVDIIRRKYLGELHEGGVKLHFYNQGNLHSKGLMIDNEIFSISSANFDYRSFRYQYELALIGKDIQVIELLKNHFNTTLKYCQPFNYDSWKRRSRLEKFFEWLLLPFRFLC